MHMYFIWVNKQGWSFGRTNYSGWQKLHIKLFCVLFSQPTGSSVYVECWLVAEINICYGSMDEVILVVGANVQLCIIIKCKMWIMNVIQCPIKCLELEGRLLWRDWIQFYRDDLLEIRKYIHMSTVQHAVTRLRWFNDKFSPLDK